MSTLSPMERGRQLKALRARAKLTQKQVGDHFGIDKASVSAWEKGGGIERDRLSALDKLYDDDGAVLEAFGISVDRGARAEIEAPDVELVEAPDPDLMEAAAALRRLSDLVAENPDNPELQAVADNAVQALLPPMRRLVNLIGGALSSPADAPGVADLRSRLEELERQVQTLQAAALDHLQDDADGTQQPGGATDAAPGAS